MAKIMVVDDAAFLRAMLKDILVKAGHEVVFEASNGQEAVEKYKSVRPDLVTMDITMPVMEGVEAVKEIRKMDPSARIVMCSAMGQRNLIIDAIKSGAKDFIVKPFQANRVVEAVENAIS
ncbi:response regulator [Cohnella cholangitidis]|uniref:Response regulator n=1 Tax=Cohnella cholangitidis TaxID=2598458 RepID=A0A7G5C1N0_9BACL|nr:response regulator [Cohnella cholangitidis]QMV43114.1 response regulator [Cohnella cholangitidis]